MYERTRSLRQVVLCRVSCSLSLTSDSNTSVITSPTSDRPIVYGKTVALNELRCSKAWLLMLCTPLLWNCVALCIEECYRLVLQWSLAFITALSGLLLISFFRSAVFAFTRKNEVAFTSLLSFESSRIELAWLDPPATDDRVVSSRCIATNTRPWLSFGQIRYSWLFFFG